MAVANHPLCEPVRFAHYKALVPIREVDGIVYVSGHGPEDINTYEPLYRGRVGTDLTLEDGYNAAAECAKTLLRAVQQRYGSLDCIHHLVRATALVNCGEGFTQPEKVVDGFSDTCMEILQERGYHTRTIMGTHNMPNHNIPVEVEMIFVLADRYRNTLGGNQDSHFLRAKPFMTTAPNAEASSISERLMTACSISA